jgi:hypothetical protein
MPPEYAALIPMICMACKTVHQGFIRIARQNGILSFQPLIRAPTGCRSWVDRQDQGRDRGRAHPCRARERRRSGRGFVVRAEGWPSMSTSAWRTLVAIRPRGARSGDAGRPLRVAPRSRPCSAAGRLLDPARPCPAIDESWTCTRNSVDLRRAVAILPLNP